MFLTPVLDGGEWSTSCLVALPPVPIEWAPEPVWMQWQREKFSA